MNALPPPFISKTLLHISDDALTKVDKMVWDEIEKYKGDLKTLSFEEQIFYSKIYSGILFFQKQNNIMLHEISTALGYSKNHFGCIVRNSLSIEVDQLFNVCGLLSVSFMKLMLHASCIEVFTNKKGEVVSVSDYELLFGNKIIHPYS
jgi:hypothetical protein